MTPFHTIMPYSALSAHALQSSHMPAWETDRSRFHCSLLEVYARSTVWLMASMSACPALFKLHRI